MLQLPLVQVDVCLGADEAVAQQILRRRALLGVLLQAAVLGGVVGVWVGLKWLVGRKLYE